MWQIFPPFSTPEWGLDTFTANGGEASCAATQEKPIIVCLLLAAVAAELALPVGL
ncbi:MAG: hypothetical protein NTU66_00635 [Elusimicrobia bacterium]|nr:hypothetical protein [Elusimicrobiota bacterium]